MGLILLYLKFENPEAAFTHTLNELRYYINCGIVVLICTAGFMIAPVPKITLVAFFITIPLHLIIIRLFPEMNYFVRAMWVILVAFIISAISGFVNGWKNPKDILQSDSKEIKWFGIGLFLALVMLHVIFH